MNPPSIQPIDANARVAEHSGKLVRWFVLSASGIFLVTGSAKIVSAWFGTAGILTMEDPIFGIPYHELMFWPGLVELFVALVGFFWSNHSISLGLIVWMATNLAAYRIGLWYLGWHGTCPCFGNLTEALHIRPEQADFAIRAALYYLLLGGWLSICWRCWRCLRRKGASGLHHPIQSFSTLSIIVLILTLASVFSNRAKASEYELSGTVEYDRFSADGKVSSADTIQFRMHYKDCQWFIEQQGVVVGNSIFVSCDGKYTYQYNPGPKDAPANDPNLVVSSGVVRGTKFPPPGGYAGPLWISFASQCYLDESKSSNSFPAVFLSIPGVSEPISCLASITREDQEPKLPSEIIFTRNQDPPQMPWSAIYRVSSWTNAGNLRVPLVAMLDIYNVQDPKSAKSDVPSLRYIIRVNELLGHSARQTFAPSGIGKYTMITDRRTQELNLSSPLDYQSDHWLTIDEVKARAQYTSLSRLNSGAPKSTLTSRRIVFAVLVISTVAMLGVFLRARRAKQTLA